MTIQEEVELLKIQLKEANRLDEQAELLLQILYIYASFGMNGVDDYLNQLTGIAETINSDKYRGWACLYRADFLRFETKLSQAVEEYNKALVFFSNTNEKQGLARTYGGQSLVYKTWGNNEKALQHQYLALDIRKEINDLEGQGRGYSAIAEIHQNTGNYPAALENYLQSLKVRQDLNDVYGLIKIYYSLSWFYLLQKDFETSKTYCGQAIELADKVNDEQTLALAYSIHGAIAMEQKDFNTSLAYFDKALLLQQEAEDKEAVIHTLSNIGVVYSNLDLPELALSYFLKALDEANSIESPDHLATLHLNLGGIHKELNKPEVALSHWAKALELAQKHSFKELEWKILEDLYLVYKSMDNYQLALEYYELATKVKEALSGSEKTKQLAQVKFQVEYEKQEAEKRATEKILHNILPQKIAERIKTGDEEIIERFENCTVLFADIVGFTKWSAGMDVKELAVHLNRLFQLFDELANQFGVEKIKTIGDAYMCVAGLPEPCANHAERIMNMALAMHEKVNEAYPKGEIKLRIGLNSGEVIAGVLGKNKYAYDLWGDTVNTASRMESNGEAGKVNISSSTYELVKDKFNCTYRGKIQAKGKGEMDMYFAESF